ncbi:MAG: hypothetical protein KC503_18855, partial [Myxococcales bacterium]|nr:hypothetical protein [Myxococcales bacterium]
NGVPTRVSDDGRFKTFRDAHVGYQLRIPSQWRLAQRHVRKFGAQRFAVPFVRYQRSYRGWTIRSSMHVLVREAAGQDVHGLWRSIYAHRRSQDPYMRVLRVIPFKHKGHQALIAIYQMRGGYGRVEQIRSFCVVANGRAYELKARANARWRSPLWVEIGDIFKSFDLLTPR